MLALTFHLLVIAGFALQPPSPAPTETGQQEQTQSAGEQQVGKNNDYPAQAGPPAITQRKEDVNASDGANKRAENEDNATTDWNRVVALGTIALAIFAFVQVVVYGFQAYYMRRGLRATEIAANAAKKSADVAEQSLHDTERAYIDVGSSFIHSWDQNPKRLKVFVNYAITNNGRTPADITRAAIRLHFNEGDIPGPPMALESDPAALGQLCAGGDPRKAEGKIELTEDQWAKFESGRFGYWWSIVVDFRDAFDQMRSQEFWWRVTPGVDRGTHNVNRCPAPPAEK